MTDNKTICIIISQIDRWIPFEWIYFYLRDKGYSQSYILLTEEKSTFFYRFLTEQNCPVKHVPLSGKKSYPSAYFKIRAYIVTKKPEIVHCHFLDASVLGLLAAYMCNVPKRIYTRHHGFFHHDYFPKGVWLDKFCNRLATHIIAISSIVKTALLKECVFPDKISIVHHGFILTEFSDVHEERIVALVERYNPRRKRPIVGVIARHIELKGIQYIIPAFRKILNRYPEAFLVLANARGSYHNEINHLLDQNIPKESYVLIPFEQDVQALYKIFDVYVHVPIDEKIEAFGQTYVEALAAGIPSVFTKSGIANDFIEDERNALVVPFRNSEAIYSALLRVLTDETLRESLILEGKKSVEKFDFHNMADQLDSIYFES